MSIPMTLARAFGVLLLCASAAIGQSTAPAVSEDIVPPFPEYADQTAGEVVLWHQKVLGHPILVAFSHDGPLVPYERKEHWDMPVVENHSKYPPGYTLDPGEALGIVLYGFDLELLYYGLAVIGGVVLGLGLGRAFVRK